MAMTGQSMARWQTAPAWTAAVLAFAIHAANNARYGFFRDELYYIVCGLHPQLGYVDQPPLVPLIAAATQISGHSLFALRLVSAAFAAAGAFVTCRLAAEFGGRIFAQALAAIVFLVTPILVTFGTIVIPDTVGLWTWPFLALLVVRIAKGRDSRLWLAAGAVTGMSLQSKYSVVFLVLALLAGLLLTPARDVLRQKWCAAGALLAIAIALPNFLWQLHYGFPMIELLQAGQNGKNLIAGPVLFLLQELIITGFFIAPVWIAGFVWLVRSGSYRFLGYAYIVLIAAMIVLHGKHYYPADFYPILIAAGGTAIEFWTAGIRALRPAIVAFVVLAGVSLIPTALPVLTEAAYVRYEERLHISRTATETEHGRENSALPAIWADMHGWPELANTVERVYDALPRRERARAVVFAGNYGEASAVAFFTPQLPVISPHNQYWLWGTHGYTGDIVVLINDSCGGYFRSATLAAYAGNAWAISYESNVPIWVCRGIKEPLARVWPRIKKYE